jgi:hypothetical protein
MMRHTALGSFMFFLILLRFGIQGSESDIDLVQRDRAHRKLSIVFLTNRPGGYDVLLNALAKQTANDYELICIDELDSHRAESVQAMAVTLGVNLVVVTKSKAKSHPTTPFGLANAINTGLILASGSIITLLHHHVFLPPDFVERTLRFHAQQPHAVLSHPEHRFSAPRAMLDPSLLRDSSSTTVFRTEVSARTAIARPCSRCAQRVAGYRHAPHPIPGPASRMTEC